MPGRPTSLAGRTILRPALPNVSLRQANSIMEVSAMTPLAGFVLALIAGWIVRDGRRAAALIVIPFLAITAVQTWGLAIGDGHSPPSTVTLFPGAIGYWVVQVLIFAPSLGVAALLGSIRSRGLTPQDPPVGRRTLVAAVVSGVLTIGYLAIAIAISAPVKHHSANGGPPPQGFIGMGALLVALIVLGVLAVRGRRAVLLQG